MEDPAVLCKAGDNEHSRTWTMEIWRCCWVEHSQKRTEYDIAEQSQLWGQSGLGASYARRVHTAVYKHVEVLFISILYFPAYAPPLNVTRNSNCKPCKFLCIAWSRLPCIIVKQCSETNLHIESTGHSLKVLYQIMYDISNQFPPPFFFLCKFDACRLDCTKPT